MHLPTRYEKIIYACLFLELLTLKLEGFLEVFFWRNEVCLEFVTSGVELLCTVFLDLGTRDTDRWH